MKYDAGKIYKIISNVTGEQYIGSTTQELDNRLKFHKNDYYRWLNGERRFMSSFNIITAFSIKKNTFFFHIIDVF